MKIWNEIEKIQDKDKRIKLHLEIFPLVAVIWALLISNLSEMLGSIPQS